MNIYEVKKICSMGFSLIEISVVIAILGILASIAVPAFYGYVSMARDKICETNCLQLRRMYEGYLGLENLEHTEAVFEQFVRNYSDKICPEYGYINYIDGKVRCSIHSRDGNNEDESIPFL